MAQLPGTLRHAPAYAFVGRAPELALLRSLLPRAPGEGGRVALVSGEAGAGDARVLLLASYRDVGEGASPELTETLIELRRSEGVTRLRLGGLSAEDIGEFARVNSGVEPDPELARVIGELSGGNAFLVTE